MRFSDWGLSIRRWTEQADYTKKQNTFHRMEDYDPEIPNSDNIENDGKMKWIKIIETSIYIIVIVFMILFIIGINIWAFL